MPLPSLQDAEAQLVAGLQGLGIQKLRGMPTPAGKHIKFDDDGEVEGVQGQAGVQGQEGVQGQAGVVKLRGVPTPQGKHIKFDD